jgi:hypothetical protein
MRITRLKILHTSNASVGKLAYSNNTYAIDLFHLQGAIIPDSRSETPLQHQCAMDAYRVTKTYLAVDDASNQAVDVSEHDLGFHGILRSVLCHFTIE